MHLETSRGVATSLWIKNKTACGHNTQRINEILLKTMHNKLKTKDNTYTYEKYYYKQNYKQSTDKSKTF